MKLHSRMPVESMRQNCLSPGSTNLPPEAVSVLRISKNRQTPWGRDILPEKDQSLILHS